MQMSFPDYRVGWLLIALVRESVGHILQAVGVAHCDRYFWPFRLHIDSWRGESGGEHPLESA